MADAKVSAFTALAAAPAVGDLVPVIDISDTTQGAGGTAKKVTVAELFTSPTFVTPALGTPASGVATNLTGTAAGLTAGNVTTNANLTGPVTSVGNATAIADAALSIAKTSGLQTALDAKAPKDSPVFTTAVTLPVALTGVIRADSGVVSVDSDVTDIVAAASTTAAGKVELATSAETITGTDTDRAVTPAAAAAAYQPLDADLTTIAGLTATTDNFIQSKASAWASRTPTQVTADLISMVGDSGSGGTKGLVPAPATGDATKFLKGDGTWASIPGGGDALVANPLSQFAATTSLQLKGVMSDETGSGALVFATSPALVTPDLGTPSAAVLTNATGLPATGLVADTTTAIGVGSINLGHASDTTITRVSAGLVAIEGVNIETTATTANSKKASIVGFFDGGGSAIANGTSSICVPAVFAGTITAYTITVDTGTCTIKTWKKATGTAIPTVSDSISTSGVSLSTGTVVRSTTVTDFTSTTVSANDLFIFNITAISGATKISFSLEITKT